MYVKPFHSISKKKCIDKHYLDMDNERLPLWLVLQGEVKGPKSSLPLLSLGLVHSWGRRLAGEGAGRRREVTAVHHPRLGEPCMGRRQFQIRGAPHLLVVVMEWFGGDVAIQIPFLQIQMQGRSGIIWA